MTHMVAHVNGRCGRWRARVPNMTTPHLYVPRVGTEEY